MPVLRLVAVARRALFDEPCALLSDDRDVPTLMAVPLAPGLARVLDPWLGGPPDGGEVTIDLVGGSDGGLRAVVTPVPLGPGRDTPLVDAITLSHRSRVPIRVDAGLLAEHGVEPCDIDRVVPVTDRPPSVPTLEQQQRLAQAFSALEGPGPEGPGPAEARRGGSSGSGPPVP